MDHHLDVRGRALVQTQSQDLCAHVTLAIESKMDRVLTVLVCISSVYYIMS